MEEQGKNQTQDMQVPELPVIEQQEIEEGKAMALLAYIFFIIPLLAARENRFAMFHTEQALVLVILGVAISIVSSVLSFTCIIPIIGLIAIVVLMVFWVMGIVYALQGQVKLLPYIGKYGEKFDLVK